MNAGPTHLVLVTVFPGVDAFDVAAPAEVFTMANHLLPPGRARYELRFAGPVRGTVRSASGLALQADLSFDELRDRPDTVVVSGRMDVGQAGPTAGLDPDVVSWLATEGKKAGRVAAVCAGSHMAAAAGLLEGHRATTHWATAARLATDHPGVQVDADPIFVRSGRMWTSAGITSSLDLALALVAEDHGDAGWYRYFEQVNVSGAALSPIGALLNNVALLPPAEQGPPISPVSPYVKRQVEVLGHTMSFVDEGTGTPVVFVHGDVMSSFLWRNVIPHLEGRARGIAVDLIGAGDSDKLPGSGPGTYTFATHTRYFTAWMASLDLPDGVVLVGHDWGANIAFDWAMRHEDKVLGLAFSEAITPPFAWDDWPAGMRAPFAYLRSPEGERDVLENNFFVRAAPRTMTRMLTPAEFAEIERPYARPGENRRPTIDWPREVPFGDDRTETRTALEAQAAWLAAPPLPKLHLPGAGGGIARPGGRRRELISTWPNLTETAVPGLHWTPEDSPHAMGAALAEWLPTLAPRPAGGTHPSAPGVL